MVAKKAIRKKHIPLRTCVGCRKVLPKRTLIRIVRTSEGVQVDLTGKMNGRGAYLHNQPSCWKAGLKGALAQALKTELTEEERKRLSDFAADLLAREIASDGDAT